MSRFLPRILGRDPVEQICNGISIGDRVNSALNERDERQKPLVKMTNRGSVIQPSVNSERFDGRDFTTIKEASKSQVFRASGARVSSEQAHSLLAEAKAEKTPSMVSLNDG